MIYGQCGEEDLRGPPDRRCYKTRRYEGGSVLAEVSIHTVRRDDRIREFSALQHLGSVRGGTPLSPVSW